MQIINIYLKNRDSLSMRVSTCSKASLPYLFLEFNCMGFDSCFLLSSWLLRYYLNL